MIEYLENLARQVSNFYKSNLDTLVVKSDGTVSEDILIYLGFKRKQSLYILNRERVVNFLISFENMLKSAKLIENVDVSTKDYGKTRAQ